MTAPTEAEIREAARKPLEALAAPDISWIYDLLAPLRYTPPDEDGPPLPWLSPGLWNDLRPSQHARLNALMEDIYTKGDSLIAEYAARITEYVVEAALTFATEFPDAPRAKAEPVSA